MKSGEDSRFLDQDSRFLDQDSRFLDQDSRFLDEDSRFLDQDSPLLDEDPSVLALELPRLLPENSTERVFTLGEAPTRRGSRAEISLRTSVSPRGARPWARPGGTPSSFGHHRR